MHSHTRRPVSDPAAVAAKAPRYTCIDPFGDGTCGRKHATWAAAERCCSRDTEDGVNERRIVEVAR